MANRGVVYKTDKGEYAIAYHKEQSEEFSKLGKVFVHLTDEEFEPVKDDNGKQKKVLKSLSTLTHVGFCD